MSTDNANEKESPAEGNNQKMKNFAEELAKDSEKLQEFLKLLRARTGFIGEADKPVAFLYFADGYFHYAGSCCEFIQPHSSEIISPFALPAMPCPNVDLGDINDPYQKHQKQVSLLENFGKQFVASSSLPEKIISLPPIGDSNYPGRANLELLQGIFELNHGDFRDIAFSAYHVSYKYRHGAFPWPVETTVDYIRFVRSDESPTATLAVDTVDDAGSPIRLVALQNDLAGHGKLAMTSVL